MTITRAKQLFLGLALFAFSPADSAQAATGQKFGTITKLKIGDTGPQTAPKKRFGFVIDNLYILARADACSAATFADYWPLVRAAFESL